MLGAFTHVSDGCRKLSQTVSHCTGGTGPQMPTTAWPPCSPCSPLHPSPTPLLPTCAHAKASSTTSQLCWSSSMELRSSRRRAKRQAVRCLSGPAAVPLLCGTSGSETLLLRWAACHSFHCCCLSPLLCTTPIAIICQHDSYLSTMCCCTILCYVTSCCFFMLLQYISQSSGMLFVTELIHQVALQVQSALISS